MNPDLTLVFVGAAKADQDFARAVRSAVEGLLEGDEVGEVDSNRLHEHGRPDLGLTYVQFVLRETPHICRHTIGRGRYRVHAAEKCGTACDEKWQRWAPAPETPSVNCPSCFLRMPATVDECAVCGTDIRAAA